MVDWMHKVFTFHSHQSGRPGMSHIPTHDMLGYDEDIYIPTHDMSGYDRDIYIPTHDMSGYDEDI